VEKIVKIIKLFFKPKKILYFLSKIYIRKYEGFAYDFEINGEKKLIKLLSQKKFNIIFDVGANRGDWSSVILEEFNNAKIHTFELSKSTFKEIAQNLKSERVKHNNIGLSNIEGKISYKDYGEELDVMNTIVVNASYWDYKKQPEIKNASVNSGDNYCEKEGIDFIDFLKIDVEGSENLVLEGFSKMLKQKKIRIIQFEYGYLNGDQHFLMKDFFNFFENFGYEVGVLKPQGVIFKKFSYELNNFLSGPNFIAIIKSDFEIKNLIINNEE